MESGTDIPVGRIFIYPEQQCVARVEPSVPDLRSRGEHFDLPGLTTIPMGLAMASTRFYGVAVKERRNEDSFSQI
jgi:hypothetical protein